MLSVASSQVDISRSLTIGGWMSELELMWLATQARFHEYIVEFGSLHGRSSRAMADNMQPSGKLWCIDPWAGTYLNEEGNNLPVNTYVMPYFIQNLKDHIDSGKVIPVRKFSYQFSLPHTVDMVFIDGDHRYEVVVKDIKKAYELLAIGGLICGHDYDHPAWPGVRQAVTELVGPVEIIGTIWHAIKS
jgi:predicted O-methyltransferase YrrM